MAAIRFICPFCNSLLEIDASGAGMDRSCPRCQGVFNVPLPAGSASPAQVNSPAAFAAPSPSAPATPPPPQQAPAAPPVSVVPGKVQAVRILMAIGGGVALLTAIVWASSCVGLAWPGTYYSAILGFLAIFRAASLRPPSPRGICAMQIINIVAFDVVNVVLGIVQLVLLSDPECEAYFSRPQS